MLAFLLGGVLWGRDARPQLIGFLLLALWVWLLQRPRLDRLALWLLPLTTVLWVNTNGTVTLGLALLGLTWLGELVQSRLGTAGAGSR